jgi:hypothetical protein
MLWPAQQLKECQNAQLQADTGSQAYWLDKYANETLVQLPGSDSDVFGGQLVTQERLGEPQRPDVCERGGEQLGHPFEGPVLQECVCVWGGGGCAYCWINKRTTFWCSRQAPRLMHQALAGPAGDTGVAR